MVFSSLTFLFFFLPLTLLLCFIGRNRVYRNIVLLLASLVFYSWGEPRYVLLLLATALIAWLAGLLMGRFPERKKLFMVLAAVLLVGDLAVFKYLNFFAVNLSALLGLPNPLRQIALPIGISFFTFQILSYVIDVYRGKVAVQKNYFRLLLYVSFFPQLIAGPIVRYETVERELTERRESLEDAFAGAARFIVGLAKKLILANGAAQVVDMIYGGSPALYGSAMYWLAAVAYSLQIYFDFSGYSDMAIGLGRIFGFHFLENFNDPYAATSVTDFWRRWHISLSSWFRDYVYIPLGGNRVSKARWMLNLLVVWALTGFWHGAEWNFLLWGLYYGLLLMAEKLALLRFLDKLPGLLRRVYTLLLVVVGWVIFFHTDLSQLGLALGQMFSFAPTRWQDLLFSNTALFKYLLYIPLGILCCVPGWKRLGARLKARAPLAARLLGCVALAALLLLCLAYVLSSSYNPFIYFRF